MSTFSYTQTQQSVNVTVPTRLLNFSPLLFSDKSNSVVSVYSPMSDKELENEDFFQRFQHAKVVGRDSDLAWLNIANSLSTFYL